ncbi:MAG: hypothetical protein AB1847_03645 [bacterium]
MGKLLQIINSYQMPLKYLGTYGDSLKIHIGFSGILLEQLFNKEVIDACRKIIDIPLMLNGYRESKNIEIIGMGYSHPIFPLIPYEDWDSQVLQGKEIVKEVFGQEPKGFCPSPTGFCLDMIPVLKKHGYEYVVLDKSLSKSGPKRVAKDRHGQERYSSIGNIAYHGNEIGAVILGKSFDYSREVEFSADGHGIRSCACGSCGQRNPLIADWLLIDDLICQKIYGLPEDAEFWGGRFSPYVERMFKTDLGVRSVFLRDLMHDWKVRHLISVQMDDRVTDSPPEVWDDRCALAERRRVLDAVRQFSRNYHELKSALLKKGDRSLSQEYVTGLLEKAHQWLLRSQTGCFFSENGRWVASLYENIKPGLILLKEVKRQVL